MKQIIMYPQHESSTCARILVITFFAIQKWVHFFIKSSILTARHLNETGASFWSSLD